ncbi:MarR family transcriptional regulator [Nocardia sp. SYP-A9097]|uniref:MarR family winged helix-turn-helix transcriptional regulator n=1 Tax=Nocardia sp. SYP-A9097 TaxID=2663237 RepID=UPI00132C7629|nr:MarR family winged helix-turn-helix transcriptional regulator [Nocardia sp. SYP-A9097]MRH88915.1 MarR family transcriptional regulator [Nocardia sp. SYP-A9097]
MTTENGRPRPQITSAGIVLLTLARRVETELNAALTPLGLTVARFGLLAHISVIPGASFSDLARLSGISVQSVHTAVKTLVANGLVRDSTARAGTASTIELTDAGTRLLRKAEQVAVEVDEHMFGPDADPIQRQIGQSVLAAFAAEPDS